MLKSPSFVIAAVVEMFSHSSSVFGSFVSPATKTSDSWFLACRRRLREVFVHSCIRK